MGRKRSKTTAGETATTPSKFDCDPLLFKPETPENPNHVQELFCGRERALQRALETLRRHLDIKGVRDKDHDKRPWIIHGESRSGKSHLARRVLADLPTSKKRIQHVVPARERLEAAIVLRTLFEFLRGDFFVRINDQTLASDPMGTPRFKLVADLVQKMAVFLEGGAEKATLTVEQSARDQIEVGLGTPLANKVLNFLAKFQTERTEKHSLQAVLRTPTTRDLAEVCAIIAETLLHLKLVDHFLILVDDVDLLEGYVAPQRNGRIQRSLLSEAISMIHDTPGVDVLITSRSWYAHAQKEFQTLVDLADAPPMSANELMEIHDQRIRIYGSESVRNPFLTRDALQNAASDADGLPGVFLQHLDTTFRAYQDEVDWGERDYDWFIGVLRRRFETFRDKCKDGFDALHKALKEGRLTVDVVERNPFHATVYENEFAFPSYYSESTYIIPKVMSKLLWPRMSRSPGASQGGSPA